MTSENMPELTEEDMQYMNQRAIDRYNTVRNTEDPYECGSHVSNDYGCSE